MTKIVPLEDAGLRLKEIIEALDPSDEITIISGGQPIATLRPTTANFMALSAGHCQGHHALDGSRF